MIVLVSPDALVPVVVFPTGLGRIAATQPRAHRQRQAIWSDDAGVVGPGRSAR